MDIYAIEKQDRKKTVDTFNEYEVYLKLKQL